MHNTMSLFYFLKIEMHADSAERHTNRNMGQSKSKLQGLVLPCQSGKTRKAIDHIKERYHDVSELHDGNKTDINVWISANNKMLVKQTETRMEKDLYSKEEELDDEVIADEEVDDGDADATITGSVFSWMSGTKIKTEVKSLANDIKEDIITMVVMCSNGIRIRYLDELLKELASSKYFDRKINIWIDEADVSKGSWGKYPHVLEMPMVNEVILVTGTIESIIREYQSIRVIAYETTYPPCYRRLTHAECITVEYSSSDILQCIAEVIRTRKYMAKPGMRAFVPGGFEKESHETISTALLSIGFVVIILNGTHKELRFPEGNVIDLSPFVTISHTDTQQEFSEHLSRMYVEHRLDRYPLAITGCLCLERGITFQCAPKDGHHGFLFDYGIIPPIANKATAYQTMARLFGNIGDFPNYKPCKIYTNSATFKKVRNQEEIAVNLARIMHETGQEEATLATLKDAASFEEEKHLELTPREFTTLEEVNDFLKSFTPPPGKRAFQLVENLPRWKADERFIESSLTNKLELLSYEDVTKAHLGWTKTAGLPKSSVESCFGRRLFTCYKDITDPTSIVFIMRVLTRKNE